jgi:hypothetical protein
MVVGVEAAVSMSVLSAAESVTIVFAKAVVKKMGLVLLLLLLLDSTSTAASSRCNNNNSATTLGMLWCRSSVSSRDGCFLHWRCLWWLGIFVCMCLQSQLNSSGGSMLLHD